MIEAVPIKECVGCHACESVCRTEAIAMVMNKEGFLYPEIDNNKCTQCEACLSVCPAINEIRHARLSSPDVYAAWSLDDNIRAKSSSGGIFSELAIKTFEKKGYVYGAAFNEDLKLSHRCIDSKNELQALRGSKYLQSNLKKVFNKIKQQLKGEQPVMFVGTPCQVAGLNNFLKKDYKNLLTCDVICHGVASPIIFGEYINKLEKKYKAKIIDFQFRAKPKGWKDFYFYIKFSNNNSIQELFSENTFMKGFLANIYLRPSCYDCKYSRLPRVSDITLGDFWGIWNYRPEWDNNKGVTALIINSTKGQRSLLKISKIELKPAKLQWIIAGNPCLTGSVEQHKKRRTFFKLFNKGVPFETIIMKLLPPPSFLDKILWSINQRIKNIVKP